MHCSLQQFWQMKGLVRRSFQISQDYFPETMGQLAIINAPMSFTAIWAVVKPWLSAETCEKISILGSDYQEVLLNLVEAENLPASLGGQCTCSHVGGCHLSGAGPWMDGREERREKWLNGEVDDPGVQWQPQQGKVNELQGGATKLEGTIDSGGQKAAENATEDILVASPAEVASS
ncbi:hypothetical protein EVG20_g8456 [Dentipellis fragilis]|uniref:CRAL-TRIO domain-containing protein n=1 Tax=Dentipellis fragilis TaxID=205917 RepID=A0A4Y9Y8A0_9AGAM|nr:hypothetical protein EVG20_g8456 [Dentipellis fragilis]